MTLHCFSIIPLISSIAIIVAQDVVPPKSKNNDLPSITFWDSALNNWPSDLISIGDYNTLRNNDNPNNLDPNNPTFFSPLIDPHIFQGQNTLDSISIANDPLGQILANAFNTESNEIEVKTFNGAWIDTLVLPDPVSVPNLSRFQLSVESAWSVNLQYNNDPDDPSQVHVETVTEGNMWIVAVVNSRWTTSDETNSSIQPTAAPVSTGDNDDESVLHGTVLFAQFQVIPSKHGIPNDQQPHLTPFRDTLVMLDPKNIENSKIQDITVSVLNDNGEVISENIQMEDPSQIPKHAGYLNLDSINIDNVEFPSSLSNAFTIQGQENLNEIHNDPEATVLEDLFNTQNSQIVIQTQNGAWVQDVYIPDGKNIPIDSRLQLSVDSSWPVTILYKNAGGTGFKSKTASQGEDIVLILIEEVWYHKDDFEHNSYIFSHDFYSTILEREYIKPGFTLQFEASTNDDDENKLGVLFDMKVGATTELMVTTIDLGFLTPPRGQFPFRDDFTTHLEYFETAPLSRMIVVQYETMHFEEIMLPSGKLYTDASDDEGGWQKGDMREHIGKILISHGIDLANYGIHSSHAISEDPHPFTCTLLAAHNAVGMYQNGRVVHGGSGGNGMITLDESTGNEMSHELGHNYGLGHFVGGFDGSVHRPSDKINSSWGWDSSTNTFIPNFETLNSGNENCLDDECQSPYLNKFNFGSDPMANGNPMWFAENRFSMYTPYVAKIIQSFLENKAVFDPSSSTGYRKFDESTQQMKEYINDDNGRKVPRLFRVPVTTLVGYYDPSQSRGLPDYIYPALHGAYGFVYHDEGENISTGTSSCYLKVKTQNGNKDLYYSLTTEVHSSDAMNKFHINIATEEEPFEASIFCYGNQRTSRVLNSPKLDDPLLYKVTGIPFGSNNQSPTTSPAPFTPTTPAPSRAPTPAPTPAPAPTPLCRLRHRRVNHGSSSTIIRSISTWLRNMEMA